MIMEGMFARTRGVAAAAQKLAKRFAAYERLLADPQDNVFARRKELAGLEGLVSAFPDSELRKELDAWLTEERDRVAGDEDEFRFRFGTTLASALKEVGLEARGQMPLLRVGMFTLKTDLSSGTATVFWGPEADRLKTGLRLVPGVLAKTLRTWTDDLRERSVEPSDLRSLLAKACARVCRLNGLEPGSRIPLMDALGELVMMMQPKSFRADPSKSRFVEYPRVRFSFDLYRLKTSGEAAQARDRLRLHVATFDATTRKTKALWVPDNETGEGTYYSYVSFPKGG